MEKKNFLLSLCVSLLCSLSICGQSSKDIEFTLYKAGGHYFIESDINGDSIDLMLESGIPALLIDEEFYVENQPRLHLDVVASNSKLNLGGRIFEIKYTSEGKVNIGKAFYEGPIFVLAGESIPKLPIQYLKNPNDNSSIITIDLPNNSMRMEAEASFKERKGTLFKRNFTYNKNMGWPVINTKLVISSANKNAEMNGKFIIDFGNASLLFLMKQHKGVDSMIADSGLELQEARNPQGQVVAEGLFAEKVTILNSEFTNASVGVTDKMKTIKEAGFIGLKFFQNPITFDFDKKKIYVDTTMVP